MDHLDDELDLRFHKGLEPEVYYRCPTLESLHGALRNELDKSASSLIPTAIVTEFIFAASSTLTISSTQQPHLDALIEPADFLQTITVEHALCRNFNGKDRLKAQKAIARSIIEAIEDADGFKYTERSASNTKFDDGARLRYVCKVSPQGRVRGKPAQESEVSDDDAATKSAPPTFDCGGAIHVKFSIKRKAINVVYKHNSIHTHSEHVESAPIVATTNFVNNQAPASDTTKGTKKRKRNTNPKEPVTVMDSYQDPDKDMSTSPGAPRSLPKKSRKKSGASTSVDTTQNASAKKGNRWKEVLSPTNPRNKAVQKYPSAPPRLAKRKTCIRCREKKIKCNEAKPSCDQCQRGLWACLYEVAAHPKRSKNGCINCKQRKRKCTEEKPCCTYCVRIDEDCEYADYS